VDFPSHDVFISYAHADEEVVQAVVDELETRGLSTVVAQRAVRPGESFKSFMEAGIRKTRYTLVMLSQRSLASPWVGWELNFTLEMERVLGRQRLLVGLLDWSFLQDDAEGVVTAALDARLEALGHGQADSGWETSEDECRRLRFWRGRLGEVLVALRGRLALELTGIHRSQSIWRIVHEVHPVSLERRRAEILELWHSGESDRAYKLLLTFVYDHAPGAARGVWVDRVLMLSSEEERGDSIESLLQDLLDGGELDNRGVANNRAAAKPVVECSELTRVHGAAFTLGPVGLRLFPGEITGVVGENANGKTTLFRVLAGELAHSSGSLCYPGLEGGAASSLDWVQVKRKVAYVPQELPAQWGTIRQNLEYEAAVRGIRGAENAVAVDYIVNRIGLSAHQHQTWRVLSGGFRLRFSLARALVWRPRLLVLDEPLANLDAITQQTVLQDLRDLSESSAHRMAVLISSQHILEVEAIADQMVFLDAGRVRFQGGVNELGRDRGTNVYEVVVRGGAGSVRAALEGLSVRSVVDWRVHLVVTTGREVSGRKVLRALLNARLEVLGFRDVSCSTKRLLGVPG